MEIQRHAIAGGQRVMICDDLLATGGTAAAAASLVEEVGGSVAGFLFIIELAGLGAQRGSRGTATSRWWSTGRRNEPEACGMTVPDADRAEVAVFGGTGMYDSGLLEDAREINVKTPYGRHRTR